MRTKIFILGVLLTACVPAWSKELSCQQSTIKYIYFGNIFFEKSPICFSETSPLQKSFIVSLECKNLECLAMNHLKYPMSVNRLSSEIGSPGFALCHKLSAKPQLIEYQYNGLWHTTSRCQFADKSYIEIPYLMKLWEDYLY